MEKFPERFNFILTSSLNNPGGNRYASRVFTEQGVVMISIVYV